MIEKELFFILYKKINERTLTMKRVTKKNAWVVELYDDIAQESRKRITIPNEALKEAGWNPDNCFYIANYLDEYGMIELTQDGRRNDVGKSHVISKSKGHPLVQVNFNPFKKLRDADFYNVVVEVDSEYGAIFATPMIV